jgi:general secretion pathway protein B
MSVILDALKKLDREKTSRRSGAPNIAVEVLRPDLPPHGKRIRFYVAAFFLTAFIAAAITYALMMEFGSLSKLSPPVPLNLPTPSKQIGSPPYVGEPVHKTQEEMNLVPPKIEKPAKIKRPLKVETTAEVKVLDEVKAPPEVKAPVHEKSTDERKTSEVIKSPPISPVEKKVTHEAIPDTGSLAPSKIEKPIDDTPRESIITQPSLKISAIVWYEDPSKRFAMINGMIATEGSVIDGMKVIEIQPTRIRFLRDGQPFEISISK